MSFRRKVFIGQLVLFFSFLLLLYPFVERAVISIVQRTLRQNTDELIAKLTHARSEKGMIELLKAQEYVLYFRAGLLNEKGELLYDSSSRYFEGKQLSFAPSTHPEVVEALKNGEGYYEGHSQLFPEEKFAYVAKMFDFQGRKYILRTAFPFEEVEDLTRNFEIGFLILSIAILILFSAMTSYIFYRFSRPIQGIIKTIKTAQDEGKEIIPQIVIDPALGEEDDFNRLASTLNNLSQRVEAQIKNIVSERNEKEAILESLGEGVIAVDGDMVVRYINFTAGKMLGISKRHLLGKSLLTAKEKASPLLLDKSLHLLKIAQEKMSIVTDSLLLGDGRKVYLDLVAAPKAEGSGAILVLQDKSSHHKVLEMGKDFVANASHELRTPITIIKGFAETLQDLPEITPEMLSDITEKIVRNCERMDTLVRNLLTLADIENLPESRFRSCDLVHLVENCRHLVLLVEPDAHIDIKQSQDEVIIEAEPDFLELAIMNLFNNAVKYSSPPAHITVVIEALDEEAKITISDQGIGIPAPDLEHIFQRFYTVDKTHSRKLGGAGLGLSIVKTIVDKHDGSISVASTVGKGTTFTLLLPLRRHLS